jgi:antitoxin YobK
MGYINYQRAIELIEDNKYLSDFCGPRSDELIEKAENVLGLKFPKSYRDFVKRYGAGSFRSEEILGVIDDNFEHSTIPDGIWLTLDFRHSANLPCDKLVFYFDGGEEYFCLDFGKLNEENEPAVVGFVPNVDEINPIFEFISNDFGDFLLEIVQRELEKPEDQ